MTMDASARLAQRLSFLLLLSLAGAVVLPRLPNPAVARLGDWVGPVAGALLFAALARRAPRIAIRTSPLVRLGARSGYLALAGSAEEVVWRGFMLRAVAQVAGVWFAFASTTVAFAVWHTPRLGRRSALHLVTGGTFGGVVLVTGSVLAAAAAHATYNILVGSAVVGAAASQRHQETVDSSRA